MSVTSTRLTGPVVGIRRSPSRKLRLLALTAAAILTVSAVMSVSAASASLTVPSQATLGSRITIAGSGFGSGQTGNLTYNGGLVTGFSASTAGAFSVSVTVPSWAVLGTGRISAKDAAGNLLATSTVTIVAAAPTTGAPSITVPAQAAPATQIVVSGSGFAAGQAGNLTINGCLEATFAADSSGAFSVMFPIPAATTLGTGRISAKTTTGSLIATTTLTIGSGGPTPPPAATASPTPASVGPTPTPAASTAPVPTASPTPASTAAGLPNFSHVYVIIFENKEYSSVVGSSSAPYTNALIAKYGLSTNFYAERHPSEPNYIALTSGGTQGLADDGVYNLGVNNLFDQIASSGRTWHAYQQGYPGNCFTGASSPAVVDGDGKSGTYVRKHNPAISYTSISGNAAACANISSFASFDPAAANFEFITPNMINDMHDGTVADGDNFLRAFLPRITGSAAFDNSLVLVTFDEGTTNVNGGGHIVTIAITPNMTPGFKAGDAYTHYSMLRTIEQAWGLPTLGNASSAVSMAFPY
jgi:hypothetical protein